MGNKTQRLPSVSSEGASFQKRDPHLTHPGIDIEEAVGGREILCDCHCGPMYYFPVSLTPTDDFVMCWVSECGRCYNKSLGYFYLRATRSTLERINEDTRSMALCPNENCSPSSSMAITRSDEAFNGQDKTCWYCLDCGTEFPRRQLRGLWERLLQSFKPPTYQRLSANHHFLSRSSRIS
jgi:hypothetical protein